MKPLSILVFSLMTAWSQAPTGEITGTVTDPTGAIVAGASLTVTNPATNTSRKVTTNTSGVYSLPALLPGA